jgi:hypothetical protein
MRVNISGSTVAIDGIQFSGPKFHAAEKVCQPLGSTSAGNQPVSEQQRLALLTFARCMRHHGFRLWADPTFPPGGGIFGGGGPYPKHSPAVIAAAKACNTTALSAG